MTSSDRHPDADPLSFNAGFCFSARHSGSHQLLGKWKSARRDGAVVSPVVVAMCADGGGMSGSFPPKGLFSLPSEGPLVAVSPLV